MITKLFGTDIKNKINRLLSIVIPIFITQTAIMGMSFFDTVMSGRAGAEQLAGTSMGSNLWMPVFTTLNGILIAATPIMAHHLGAGHRGKIAPVIRQGLILAAFFSVLCIATGALALRSIFEAMGLEPQVIHIATYYLGGISLGMIPFFMSTVLRALVDTMGGTGITMKLYLLALPINGLLNYVLIYGKLGLPALGGIGAGVATGITCWIIFGLFLGTVLRIPKYAELGLFKGSWVLDKGLLLEYIHIGLPIGLSIFMETSIFGVVAFFVVKFGTAVIAGHQTAISFSSLLYMIPLSMSMGMTIIIGIEAGAKRWQQAEHYSNLGLACNWLCALCIPAFVYFGRYHIAALYSTTPKVIQYGAEFIAYSCFFQMLDAVAAPIQGILRGYKDVKATFYSAIFAYWVVCLPLGLYLDYGRGHQAYSYWQSLDIGLFFSALVLFSRLMWLRRRLRQEQSRGEEV